jgi:hypothetical protein
LIMKAIFGCDKSDIVTQQKNPIGERRRRNSDDRRLKFYFFLFFTKFTFLGEKNCFLRRRVVFEASGDSHLKK